jgi:tryptophan 2,3-dioxygenase
MYHQVNELLFKMILWEMEQVCHNEKPSTAFFTERLNRISRYFDMLTTSFDIMKEGMEPEQYLKFRNTLTPASGFQSAQYRMIEIYATHFINLVAKDKREEVRNKDIHSKFPYIYWKNGATELATGKKTLTLLQFEKKYELKLINLAEELQLSNIYSVYERFSNDDKVKASNVLRNFDVNVNINWPLCHYKSAVRYLQKSPEDIAATGGTNWQKYLPPRFQKRIFYPELWTLEEIENWGKAWIETNVFNK